MKTAFYHSLLLSSLLLTGCHSANEAQDLNQPFDIRFETASVDSPTGVAVGVLYINDKPVMVHSTSPDQHKSQHRFYLKSAKDGSNILLTTDHEDEQLMFILDQNYVAREVYLLVEQQPGRWQYQLQNNELSQHYCAKHVVLWKAATNP